MIAPHVASHTVDLLVAFIRDSLEMGASRQDIARAIAETVCTDSHPFRVSALLAAALGRLASAGECADCAKAATVSALLEA